MEMAILLFWQKKTKSWVGGACTRHYPCWAWWHVCDSTLSQRLTVTARVSLHSRINLSPFTKDFRGGEHLRVIGIFGCSAHSRATCVCSKTEDFLSGAVWLSNHSHFPSSQLQILGQRMIVRFTNHKRVVVGETKLFKAFNWLLYKLINCFDAFGRPHWWPLLVRLEMQQWKCHTNSGQTCIKQPFTNHCKCFLESKTF